MSKYSKKKKWVRLISVDLKTIIEQILRGGEIFVVKFYMAKLKSKPPI